MQKQGLYRSTGQNMIAGVMGGIAERFGWNANLLRIIFVIISLMSAAFPGILVYLVLWLIMPKRQFHIDSASGYHQPIRTVNSDSNRPL